MLVNDLVMCVYLVSVYLVLISVNVEDYVLMGVNEVCYVLDMCVDFGYVLVLEFYIVV